MSNELRRSDLSGPLGEMFAYSTRDERTGAWALVALGFHSQARHLDAALARRYGASRVQALGATIAREHAPGFDAHVRALERSLERWFRGDLAALSAVPLAPQGTPFQERVWRELRNIPAGETRSYEQIARAIGHGSAVRAVASANARNPISIAVPCHRVIGKNGELRGYAGGVEKKRWLLAHEARHAPGSEDPGRAARGRIAELV